MLDTIGVAEVDVRDAITPIDDATVQIDRDAKAWTTTVCGSAAIKRSIPSRRPGRTVHDWASLHAFAGNAPADPWAVAAAVYGMTQDEPPHSPRHQQWANMLTHDPLDINNLQAWCGRQHDKTNRRIGKPSVNPIIRPDRIVVLSLDSRPDRWEALTSSIAQSKYLSRWPVTRFRARLPAEMLVPDWWSRQPTIYATGRDHLAIIEQAYADGCETLMVLEDDAIIQDGFDAAYEAACRGLPADWMGLWLSSDGHRKPPVPVAPGLVRCTDQAMLHAYMLSRRGMHRVWHHCTTCYRQIIDGATEDLHGIEPHFYATAANAVRQYGDRFIGQRTAFFDDYKIEAVRQPLA